MNVTDSGQWWFLLVFPVLALAAVIFGPIWGDKLVKGDKTDLVMESTWSFKDSWAGNVTVLGGLLTGIFGTSEVVKALLGKEADTLIALAIVGAAMAAALIAAGPVILSATKNEESDQYTVRGMALAASVTVAGGFGELLIVTVTAFHMDLGRVWKALIVLAAGAGAWLLWIYYIRSVRTMAARYAATPKGPDEVSVAAILPPGARRAASL
jgi:hypothetical protein